MKSRAVAAAAVLVSLAAGCDIAHEDDADRPTTEPSPLSITWGGTEGRASCGYDAADRSVTCRLAMTGTADGRQRVTVTVSAYADENTSKQVGSTTRRLRVEGTVDRTLRVTVPVTRAPHLDEDGVVACRLETDL